MTTKTRAKIEEVSFDGQVLNPGGVWTCPSCGDVEPSEYTLTINHGWSHTRDPGYWRVRHGLCYRSYDRLFRLGWFPPGWGWRKTVPELGHFFSQDQMSAIERAVKQSQPWGQVEPDLVAAGAAVAEVVVPWLIGRVQVETVEDLMAAHDRLTERIASRVTSTLERIVSEAERTGLCFATPESVARALDAMMFGSQ